MKLLDINKYFSWRDALVISAALALFFLWVFPSIFPADTIPERGLDHITGEVTWSWYVSISMAFGAYISMIVSAVKYAEEEEG